MKTVLPLGKTILNVITKQAPLYVQYYVTSRCNFRCQQCNVIYANADRHELNTDKAIKTIENLGKLGTSVLLLTGGEPFIRKDLPELAKAAIENGMHVRIQTNGLADESRLSKCVEYGVRDISISLDSLQPNLQDFLNGEIDNSWFSTLNTISNVSKVFPENTFAVFGCVISPFNFRQLPQIVKFATQIGWWVSLVPAHKTDPDQPRSFSSFNKFLDFNEQQISEVMEIIEEIKALKKRGFHIYDSEQYLDDIKNFISKRPITWRSRNSNLCDAGSMYFAVLPDGTMAPCCDYRYAQDLKMYEDNFVEEFHNSQLSKESETIASKCSGCLYGSYPEISISARFTKASFERFLIFRNERRSKISKLSKEQLEEIAKKYRSNE
jgi:MoaA/NifB/PqqE/SkfB family radical SAM enzyme